MKKSFWWAVAACLLFAAPVMAKEGFYAGVFVPADSLSGEAGTNIDSGTGWGIRAGVGLNRYLAVEAKYSVTRHDISNGPGTTSTDLKGLAGDVKLHFPLMSLDRAQVRTLEPFVLAGYAHYESTKPSTAKSDGFQYGVGLELYLFRELSIEAGWTSTTVSFDTTPERKGDVRTVEFGITYHFI